MPFSRAESAIQVAVPRRALISPNNAGDGQAATHGTHRGHIELLDIADLEVGRHPGPVDLQCGHYERCGFSVHTFGARRSLTLDPLAAFSFDPGLVANEPVDNPDRSLVDAANAYYGFVIEETQSQFFNKGGFR